MDLTTIPLPLRSIQKILSFSFVLNTNNNQTIYFRRTATFEPVAVRYNTNGFLVCFILFTIYKY